MSDASIIQSYVETYNDHLALLSQQRGSRFRMCVMSSAQKGEGVAPVDQLAAAEAIDIDTRYQVKPLVETVHTRRWEYPVSKGWGDICDKIDKLKMNIELEGGYVETGNAAINRAMDTEIISRFFATSKTGRSGGTDVTFPAGNVVAVTEGGSGNQGMNVDKLLAARELALANEVDIDDPNNQFYCGITAAQERDLLNQVKIVNKDYQDSAVLSGGGTSLKEWFGIKFVLSQRLDVDGSSFRRNPFWCKSGMHLGIWQDITGDISERKDLNLNPHHISVNATFGATRIEENKVFEIKCAE